MAEITRDQFDPTKRVQKKIFQRNVHVVDADLNEQADVALESRRRILSCLIDHTNVRFDDGFLLVYDPSPLTVKVEPGNAAFHVDGPMTSGIERQLATIIRHAGQTELTGFDSWVAGGVTRTDLIYIDIEEKEISPSDDSNIVNPFVGAETCRDIRVEYEIKIAKGTSTLPDAPAGHVYHKLATITKDSSSDYILSTHITLLLHSHKEAALALTEAMIWRKSTESLWSNTEAPALDYFNECYRLVSTGGSESNIVIKIPYVKQAVHNNLQLRFEGYKESSGGDGQIEIKCGEFDRYPVGVSATTPTYRHTALSLADAVEGVMYTVEVVMHINSAGTIYMQKPIITAGLTMVF